MYHQMDGEAIAVEDMRKHLNVRMLDGHNQCSIEKCENHWMEVIVNM